MPFLRLLSKRQPAQRTAAEVRSLPSVALRPMTEDEFDALSTDAMWEGFAQERARNLGTPLELERAAAAQQRALLGAGLQTPGQLFWTVLDAAGRPVGSLWVSLDEDVERGAHLSYIVIGEPGRGRGFGAAALAALERELLARDIRRLSLNVFGDNAAAQRLYRQAGYHVGAITMVKSL